MSSRQTYKNSCTGVPPGPAVGMLRTTWLERCLTGYFDTISARKSGEEASAKPTTGCSVDISITGGARHSPPGTATRVTSFRSRL